MITLSITIIAALFLWLGHESLMIYLEARAAKARIKAISQPSEIVLHDGRRLMNKDY